MYIYVVRGVGGGVRTREGVAEVAESTCRTGLARWIRTWTPARATHISGKVIDRVFFYMMYLLATILGIPIPVSVTLGRDGIIFARE